MKFSDYMNQYIEILECSAKELAEVCDLSAAVISRYRTGEREPAADSAQLEKLIVGIAKLAREKGVTNLSEPQIRKEFDSALNQKNSDYENFTANFDALITQLDINMKALSQASSFDLSYLYRIRSGHRRPSDLDSFCNSFCQYIVSHYSTPVDKEKAASLLGCSVEQIQTDDDYQYHLRNWLYTGTTEKSQTDMESFLQNLDSFNLDEYIRAIHFDELKVPTMPFQIYSPRSYYGVEEMRKGELDFFKHTVLAKSMEPIFMCSDMPTSDMAKDMDFNQKWMIAIAMSLKKGLHLNIIHNIDRPFHEMMLGLESWIPIYMTGQVSPYHLPNVSTHVYHHFNYVSGTVALTGECISGHHDRAKLTTAQRDKVLRHAKKQRTLFEETLQNAYVYDEFATISQEEFAEHPAQLALSDAFYEADIPYTYEEYLAHIRLTKEFADTHSGYKVQTDAKQTFRNIQIHIIEGKCVRLSKSKTPVIHFAIRHPKMVSALEHFVAPVME